MERCLNEGRKKVLVRGKKGERGKKKEERKGPTPLASKQRLDVGINSLFLMEFRECILRIYVNLGN